MNAKILSLGLLVVGGLAVTHAATEDRIEKKFTVSDSGKLTIEADRGSIDVKTSTGSNIEIEVIRTVEHASDTQAHDLLQAHTISFNQEGNNLTVKAEMPKSWKSGNWHFGGPQLQVKYLVTVPQKFSADLRTSGGNISASEIGGDGKFRTSGGSIKIGHAGGPVFARTSGGNVDLEAGAKSVDAETSGGSIKLGNVEGNVTAKTSGGNITLNHVAGTTEAHTSGGSIKATEVLNTINASTSGGNVTARLTKTPAADCVFKTSGGSIDVSLAEALAVDIDARTSGGSVEAHFPVATQEKHKRDVLKTKLNGGGPSLLMQTSGGNVNIRRI